MNWFYLTFLVALSTQMVIGVPLLNRVKRQEINQLDDPAGDQNQANDEADQTNAGNDARVGLPNQDPMILDGRVNSIYRRINIAPGYGDQANSDEQAPPVISDSGQPQADVDGKYVPAENQPHVEAADQYVPPQILETDGEPAAPLSEEVVQPSAEVMPQDQNIPQTGENSVIPPAGDLPIPVGVEQGTPQYVPPQLPGTLGAPVVPSYEEAVQTGAAIMPQDQYEPEVPQAGEAAVVPPTGDLPIPVGAEQGIPQYVPPQLPGTLGAPVVPSYEEAAQTGVAVPQDQYVGGYVNGQYQPVPQPMEPAAVPYGNGVPQYKNDVNNPQYIPNAPQLPESAQNTQYGQTIQPDSGLVPQDKVAGDANQQYVPYPPPQLPESGEPLPPPGEAGQAPNPISGNANQQYIPYQPPQLPEEGTPTGELVQPGFGVPQEDQGMLAPYNPNIQGVDAAEWQPPIQPDFPTSEPVLNSTEQTSYGTDLPDYIGWPESNDDQGADQWVDQYYSYDSQPVPSYGESLSFNLFNNQDDSFINGGEPNSPDAFDFESSDEPFDPYESLDDESYENVLQEEVEEFKNLGLYGSTVEEPQEDSPSDRLQPDIYTNWQIDNSQPSSTLNPQAANNFLLYCIPAILLTLILYIGYTNYHRKPKIVNIPSGNNWRAEYRDIEAKSKEIEPMLRRAEMY